MRIELLYVEDCPSYERFLPRLREIVADTGRAGDLEMRRIESPEAAIAERFLGSPTVRVEGVDVEPGSGERCDYGIKCRLYRVGGKLRGTPDKDWIVQALTANRRSEDGNEDLA